jgi:hypothetical protein
MAESAQLSFAHENFGRISSDLGEIHSSAKFFPNWGNFAQIDRNSPEILRAKLNCAGEKKLLYCVLH